MWDCTISRWNYSVLLCSRATLENLEYKKFFKNVSRKRYKEVTFQKSGNSHFSTYFFFKWAVQNFTALNFRSFWRIFVNPELNCFCGMVDRRKAFSLISSRDHCQRSSPSRISDTLSRVWTCAEPEFRLSWMKLCSSDNHYTTAPKNTCANPLYLKLRCAISRSSHWRCSMKKVFLEI